MPRERLHATNPVESAVHIWPANRRSRGNPLWLPYIPGTPLKVAPFTGAHRRGNGAGAHGGHPYDDLAKAVCCNICMPPFFINEGHLLWVSGQKRTGKTKGVDGDGFKEFLLTGGPAASIVG